MVPAFLMHCSTRQFLFITALIGFVLMHETRTAPFFKAEGVFASWLAAYSPQAAPVPLSVIGISEEDLQASAWPWQPVDYSLFLNAALPFQPSVLAIEPTLAWKKEAEGLQTFHHQALRVPKLVLSADLGFPEDPALVQPVEETPVLRHVEGSVSRLHEYPQITAQPGEDLRHSAALGFFEAKPAAKNGVIRRVPLIFRYGGQVVPSFELQAAMLWYGVTPEEVRVVAGSRIELGSAVRIPIDAAGTMAVDFSVPVTHAALADLYLSAEQKNGGHAMAIPSGRLTNSLVLLTRTDEASRSLRFANGRLGSRGELAAAAIATIQGQRFLRPSPWQASVVVIGLMLGVGWGMVRASRLGSLFICTIGFAFYLLLALGVFSSWQVALPFSLPSGLFAFLLIFRQLD